MNRHFTEKLHKAVRLPPTSAELTLSWDATLPPNLLISSSSLLIYLAPGGWCSLHLTSQPVHTNATCVEYLDLSISMWHVQVQVTQPYRKEMWRWYVLDVQCPYTRGHYHHTHTHTAIDRSLSKCQIHMLTYIHTTTQSKHIATGLQQIRKHYSSCNHLSASTHSWDHYI